MHSRQDCRADAGLKTVFNSNSNYLCVMNQALKSVDHRDASTGRSTGCDLFRGKLQGKNGSNKFCIEQRLAVT